MKRSTPLRWLCSAVVLLAALPAAAAEWTAILPQIVEEAVVRAAAGWQIGQVELLAPVTSSEARPELRVDQVRFDPARHWLEARLRCRTTEICLPFYAVAAVKPLPMVSSAPAAKPSPAVWLVRAGNPATLVLDGERARLTMPVRCLENGARGQRVRVRAPGGLIYQAEVSDPGQLRARL